MFKKKLGWKTVLGALFIVAAWVIAYNLDRLPEKNVSLPMASHSQA